MARRPPIRALAVSALVVVAGVLWWTRPRDGDAPVVHVVGDGAAGRDATTTSEPAHPRTVPDVALVDVHGATVRLGSLTGTPLVLNFWYSTCPPCRSEMPTFQRLADDLAGRVRVVGIDATDSVDEMTAFARSVGVGYELYRDPDARATDAFEVSAFPSTVFVRADGTIAKVVLGALGAGQLRALVASELGVA